MAENIKKLKKLAASAAVDEIQSGMVLGLGTGSTAALMIDELGARMRRGQLRDIVGIPTSEATARQARALSIPLTTLALQSSIDLTIDGADEIDPQLDLIKGLGGSLLREKIVASLSSNMIIIADQSKIVDRLGAQAPLPVEVIPFAERPVTEFLRALGSRPVLRQNGEEVYITDEGNIIIDCWFAEMTDPRWLAQTVIAQPGVVEHGFFLGMATEAIVATDTGIKRLIRN